MDLETTLHTETRLIEMSARETYEYDQDTNSWKVIARDTPVDEQFNQWAHERGMNPVRAEITQNQFNEGSNRITVVKTLCAAAITREDQYKMELAYRLQVARILGASLSGVPTEQQQEPQATQQPQQPMLADATVPVQQDAAPGGPQTSADNTITLPAAPFTPNSIS